MQDQQPHRLLSPRAIAGFVALLVATGGGVAWWTWKTHNDTAIAPNKIEQSQPDDTNNPRPDSNSTPTPKVPSTVAPTTTDKSLEVYWLKPSGTKVELAPTPIAATSNSTPEALLETALKQLIAGPNQASLATTIPANTKVLDLAIKPDGIHVNLSREFTKGGGSSAMEGRLAQVLYTATSLNPDAPVWLAIEGKPLTTLGGEGLVVEQPLTRQQFAKDFPL